MAGGVDDLEPVVAEGDYLAVGEVMFGHGDVVGVVLVNLGDADGQVVAHDPLVVLVDLGQQAVAVAYQVVAVQVVVMGMSEQQTHGAQLLLLDELDEALTLARLVHAAVDDDGLARLVPDDVRALLK